MFFLAYPFRYRLIVGDKKGVDFFINNDKNKKQNKKKKKHGKH